MWDQMRGFFVIHAKKASAKDWADNYCTNVERQEIGSI